MSDQWGHDPRFDLANERTYLAWLRTGLALVAAGVAAERVLPAQGVTWARLLIGVTLALAGIVTAALARRRWEAIGRALRDGTPLPRPLLGYLISGAVVVTGIGAVILMIRSGG